MRIVQIVTQMEAGGAQKVASMLTEGLRDRGHDAQLWFLYKKRPAYEESAHVRVLSPKRPQSLQFATLAARLYRELRAEMPDAVVTHTHSANCFAAPAAALAGVPIRVAVHHNPFETYTPFMRAADRCAFAAGSYSSMVAVSGGVTHSFARRAAGYRSRLHRIYNAIAEVDQPGPGATRKRYSIPSHMKLLVNVGRLAEQKNQTLLLKLLQKIEDGFLLLVGEGELRDRLSAQAAALGVADRLRFTGELPANQVSAILSEAEVFLLPSLYESFSLAAVEAMHHGVPIVASDLSCLREVLGDQQLFFPVNDLGTLTRRVQYLLAHPALGREMGAAGMARAERYTVARMVGEYECLLAEASLYARPRPSAADNLRRLDSLGSVARIHDHL